MLIDGWNRFHAGQIAIGALHTNTDSTVTMGYNSQTLPAGYTDKFYVGGVSLTADSLDTELASGRAFLVGSNTNTSATSINLTGLSQASWYSVIGRRFDDLDAPTSTYSNHEIVNTHRTKLIETDAFSSRTFNPADDNFYDWFMPFGDANKIRVTRMSDGPMGNFVRLKNFADYSSTGITYLQYEGLKFISSRWDWSLKYKVRHNGGGTEQHRVGFVSGDQAEVNIEFYRPHGVQPNSAEDFFFDDSANWPAGYDSPSTLSEDNGNDNTCKVWGTVRTDTTYPGSTVNSIDDYRDWQIHPDTSHSDIADWQIATNAVGTIEFVYTASSDKLEIKINDVVVQEFADVQQLLTQRLKWPVAEEYPFPIAPNIRLQLLNGTTSYVDIGEITFSSSCPYDMACFLSSSGAEQSINGAPDFLNPTFIKPESGTITDGSWIEAHSQNRFSVDKHSGYTLPTSNFGSGYFTWDEGGTWDNSDSGAFKLLPVNINGRVLRKLRWSGRPYQGTVRGRLLNKDTLAEVRTWDTMSGILSQTLHDGPTSIPSGILPQVDFTYTGATGTITTAPYYSPSKFMGVELYLGRTLYSKDGDEVTLTTWTGATIYYGWVYSDSQDTIDTTYSTPLTIPENATGIQFYSFEGSYIESTRLQSFATSQVKTIGGIEGGVIKTITGQPGGIIKTLIGGSWQ